MAETTDSGGASFIDVPSLNQKKEWLTDLDLPGQAEVSNYLASFYYYTPVDTTKEPKKFVANSVQVYRQFREELLKVFSDWSGTYQNVTVQLVRYLKGDGIEATKGDPTPNGPQVTVSTDKQGSYTVTVGGTPINVVSYTTDGVAYPTISWSAEDGNLSSGQLSFGQVLDPSTEEGYVGNQVFGTLTFDKSAGSSWTGIDFDWSKGDEAVVYLVGKCEAPAPSGGGTFSWLTVGWLISSVAGILLFIILQKLGSKLKRTVIKKIKPDKEEFDQVNENASRAQSVVENPDPPPPAEEPPAPPVPRPSASEIQQQETAFRSDAQALDDE